MAVNAYHFSLGMTARNCPSNIHPDTIRDWAITEPGSEAEIEPRDPGSPSFHPQGSHQFAGIPHVQMHLHYPGSRSLLVMCPIDKPCHPQTHPSNKPLIYSEYIYIYICIYIYSEYIINIYIYRYVWYVWYVHILYMPTIPLLYPNLDGSQKIPRTPAICCPSSRSP